MADLEQRRKHLLSLLSVHQNNNTDSTTNNNNNGINPCTQQSKPSYISYQSNIYAVLYDKNQLVWAYSNNEYHRCKIMEILHPKQSNHNNYSIDSNHNNQCNDSDDELDENEATPPLTSSNIDSISNCSTPPISTQFDDDCNTPEPPISDNDDNIINDGLCNSSMPIYRVLCLTPRYKHDKPCKYFIEDNKCEFNQNNHCLFSHGWIMPQDRIKNMGEESINYTLKVNDRCLAKWYKDNIWYKAKIIRINLMKHKTLYNVTFDHYPEETHNITKENCVPYTSSLDRFHEIHENESQIIHNNNNNMNDFGNKNMVELSSSEFGKWQQHTTGIGLKYLTKFGYEIGDGLGRNKQGRSEPIPIKKIKKNVGLDFVNENIKNYNKPKIKKKDKDKKDKKRKLILDNKRNKNVFETMNKLFNGNNNNRPRKKRKLERNIDNKLELTKISELLFSLENEKNLYEKKMMNTNDIGMKQHYNKLVKKHELKIKKLKMKHNYTESKRNQDSMDKMENFKF